MPRLYNIPEWYTAEYEVEMLEVVSAIDRLFPYEPKADPAYLEALRKSNVPEHRAHLAFHASDSAPFWDGPARNVGENIIRVRNVTAFQRILPAYMRSSILVHERGPSKAENSDMPYLLSKRLDPALLRSDEFQELFRGYTGEQMETIRRVLELISMRYDDSAAIARAAIATHWNLGSSQRERP